jgi:hypothetical protein
MRCASATVAKQYAKNSRKATHGKKCTAKSVFSSQTWMILLNALPLHLGLSLSVLLEKLV